MCTDSDGMRRKAWHMEILGDLGSLPQQGKKHDNYGEEEEGPSNGTAAESGEEPCSEERGRLWSWYVMGWGPPTQLLA